MSEFLPRTGTLMLAAALVGSVVMAGCSSPEVPAGEPLPAISIIHDPAVARPAIGRCYEGTIAEPVHSTAPTWESPITLTQNPSNLTTSGDPGPLAPEVEEQVKGAVVMIGETGASGFLIAPDLVMTVAHGLHTDGTVGDVLDSQGQQASVIGGCYIRQSEGALNPLGSGEAGTIDTALLRLSRPLGTSVLTLAAQPAIRGTWGTLVNVQAGHLGSDPRRPSIYRGLFLDNKDGPGSQRMLTGVSPRPGYDPNNYTIRPGASGGVVVNAHGEVVAQSFGGRLSTIDPQELYDEHGVMLDVPGSDDPSRIRWQPRLAQLNSLRTLELAIASHRY